MATTRSRAGPDFAAHDRAYRLLIDGVVADLRGLLEAMAANRRRGNRPSPWEAVHRDLSGRQQTRAFRRKTDAQRWLDEQTAAIVTGQYVSPAPAG